MSGELVPTNLTTIQLNQHHHQTENQSDQQKIEISINKNPNVRVICRIKPLGHGEEPIDMKIDKASSEISIIQPRQETTKTFTFNRIFTDETQGEFVPEVCKRVLNSVYELNQGYLIFSYGVTNSGKTHTILGSPNEPGILPYLVKKLSDLGEVQLSAIELYNDEFFSLVNREKLAPKEINGFLDFKNCAVSEIIDKENMEQKLRLYLSNRTQNETKMNTKSSRSHAIFRIQAGNTIIGVVDLAGSERSNRVGSSIDESSNINKSLLCLGKCIKALGETSDTLPIPYRESKLTKVLIEYFAKKVEVLMIANINQSQNCFHENMKVLDYAVLAKDIQHCSSENSLKKSEFKFLKTNKVDVFEALYKSSQKVFQPHKSLKTSRTKTNEEKLKSAKSNTKAMDTNRKFARALKAQQLQMYIEKFDSSNETFEHMVEYMRQKELEEDEKRIENISIFNYRSPNVLEHKTSFTHGGTREIGVGIEQKSVDEMKKEISSSMKEELKMLLEIERLASMKDQETFVGDSLRKGSNHSIEESESNEHTPLKGKSINHDFPEESFLMKTSNQICSSVKKIINSNIQSFKKIVPKFLKSAAKSNKLEICSYSNNFTDLFKFEIVHYERGSTFSLFPNEDIEIQKASFETQTENIFVPELEKEYSEANDTTVESVNGSFSIENNETNFMIRNSEFIEDIQEESIEKEEEDLKNKANENKNNNKKKKNANKPKNKIKKNKEQKITHSEEVERIKWARLAASKLCRENTPIKLRLRGHKQ